MDLDAELSLNYELGVRSNPRDGVSLEATLPVFTDDLNTEEVVPSGQRGEIPGYTVWNLSANYDLSGPCNCTLFFTAKNLSDKSYVADMTGGLIPGMPRLLQGGFEIRF